jgi:hypothetical protein
MIPTRQFDPEFLSMLKQYIDKTPISLTELMAAIIVAMVVLQWYCSNTKVLLPGFF